MSTVDLPKINQPFIDPRSGQISRPWWIWLQQLMSRIGGTNGVDISVIEALIRQLISDVLAIERAVSDNPQGQINAGLALQIEQLEAFAAGQDRGHGHGFWEDPDMHAVATAAAAGFMSTSDKTKLDGLMASTAISNFRGYQSSTQAIAAATFTTIAFQSELFDDLSEFSTSTYEFVPAATGTYAFMAAVRGSQTVAVANRAVSLFVNGSESIRMAHHNNGNGNYSLCGGTGPTKLTAGDVVTLRYFTSEADTTTAGSGTTYFSGWRLK